MDDSTDKITCLPSILATVLKELRLERNLHQAHVAEALQKSTSALAKIENAQSTLALDTFFSLCWIYGVVGSFVLAAAERYSHHLISRKWIVLRGTPEHDGFMQMASKYYASAGFRRRIAPGMIQTLGQVQILNGPQYSPEGVYLPDVFRFVTDEGFQKQQLAEVPPPPIMQGLLGNTFPGNI